MQTLKDLTIKARTCRRYQKDYVVSHNDLVQMVDIARVAPSARNDQILRYALISEKANCDEIAKTFAIGGALKGDDRPKEGQEPNAYIVILGPENLAEWQIIDIGIAAQLIQLSATESGLAACMIASFAKEKVLNFLLSKGLDKFDPISKVQEAAQDIVLVPRLLIAIGKADETQCLVDAKATEHTTYYRKNDVNHVPKRLLEDIVLLKA